MQPTQQCGILKLMFRCISETKKLELDTKTMSAPRSQTHRGYVSPSPKSHIEDAIATALQAKTAWANMAWEQRAVFSKQRSY
jgi:acyl-CoA reductase-like NAD-dependent aldehyde dehydrogenase